jgi:hypothetical protein
MDQRNRELRLGRFTASEIHKLMGKKFGHKLDDWTDTAQTYILEKVSELYSEKMQEFTSREMEWGLEWEPVGLSLYESTFSETLEFPGFLIFPGNKECGCTPDGLVKGASRGIELKCPFTNRAHIEAFMIKNNDDLKCYKPAYYWQIMSSMLFTKMQSWDFVSFHPYFKDEYKLYSIEILPDTDAFSLLRERIKAAVETRNAVMQEIKNNIE